MSVERFSTELRDQVRAELLRELSPAIDPKKFESTFNEVWRLYADPALDRFVRGERFQEGMVQAMLHTTMDEFRGMR